MKKPEVVLCSPVRTAIGAYGGSLKDVTAPDLGATVIRGSLKRAGLAADKVQGVVMGNVIQAGVKMNPVRQAGIAGGVPVEVPAMTVNRVCGSGAQAIIRCGSGGNKRGLRGNYNRFCGRCRQCRRWCDRPWSPHWRQRGYTDNAPAPFAEA